MDNQSLSKLSSRSGRRDSFRSKINKHVQIDQANIRERQRSKSLGKGQNSSLITQNYRNQNKAIIPAKLVEQKLADYNNISSSRGKMSYRPPKSNRNSMIGDKKIKYVIEPQNNRNSDNVNSDQVTDYA